MNPTQTKEKSAANARVKVDISTEISKIGIYCIAISAGVIGCWAVVCLIAGMVTSGGPAELLTNLFSAIHR